MQLMLNEFFHTFQGEGAHAGRRALFVRMPKCNLACQWCDTSFESFEKFDVADFKEFALSEPHRFAVLTGGEPLMNRQSRKVVELLKDWGYYVAVETNGTYRPIPGIDWYTCSPKAEAKFEVNFELAMRVDEWKYVVDDDFDFSILDRHSANGPYLQRLSRLSLSPEWGNRDANLKRIFEYIKEHPEWRISLQTHKVMQIP